MSTLRTFVAVGAIVVIASACSGSTIFSPTSPTPAPVAVTTSPTPIAAPPASGSPTPSTTAAPAAVAVLPGEPWLVYGWAADESWYLGLVRPDGSDAHRILSEVPGQHKFATWSPDGDSLAFVVQDSDHPDGSIWTANADGSAAAMLSDGGTECPIGLFHPAWSADGKKLAVVCYPGGGDRTSIAVLDLGTRSIERLADFTSPETIDSAPTWSPDDQTIAFAIEHWDPTGQFLDWTIVATVPAAGGAVRKLTDPAMLMADPDWSPDGAEIAINSNDLGNGSFDQPSNLYLIKPDGTDLRQLTHSSVDGSMRIGCPSWDPDGSRIVACILTKAGDAPLDVRIGFVDREGGEPVLVSGSTDGKYPDLRPIS